MALCVYDITNKDSLRVLKNWVEELKSKGPADILLAIVGNKIDRADDEQVSYEEVKEYAQSVNAIFKLTSAKEGKGITELFTSIAERLDDLNKTGTASSNRGTKLVDPKKPSSEKGGCCGGKK